MEDDYKDKIIKFVNRKKQNKTSLLKSRIILIAWIIISLIIIKYISCLNLTLTTKIAFSIIITIYVYIAGRALDAIIDFIIYRKDKYD